MYNPAVEYRSKSSGVSISSEVGRGFLLINPGSVMRVVIESRISVCVTCHIHCQHSDLVRNIDAEDCLPGGLNPNAVAGGPSVTVERREN